MFLNYINFSSKVLSYMLVLKALLMLNLHDVYTCIFSCIKIFKVSKFQVPFPAESFLNFKIQKFVSLIYTYTNTVIFS